MKLLLILLLFIPVAAQAPATRVSPELAKQLATIADSQRKLTDEFMRLEGVKLTIKYRACLEAKMDAAACDAMDMAADKDGYSFVARPLEKKP